jgi:hypothetical protein
VTRALLEGALAALEGQGGQQDMVQVIDAFAVPRITYDPLRKLFYRSAAQPQLQADAKVRRLGEGPGGAPAAKLVTPGNCLPPCL